MAVKDTKNVIAVTTGDWYMGETTATAPASATAALTGFDQIGYITDDGTSEEHSRETNDIKAHQYSSVVKTTVTEASSTFEVAFQETNEKTLELYLGSKGEDGTFKVRPGVLGAFYSFVHDEVEEYGDGETSIIRDYIARGQVIETQAIESKAGEAITYKLKIRAFPDKDGVTSVKMVSRLAAA